MVSLKTNCAFEELIKKTDKIMIDLKQMDKVLIRYHPPW